MIPSRTLSFGGGLLALVVLLGCGSETRSVKGTVTLDGQPLEGATVLFHPVEGGRGNSIGETDESGAFVLDYTSTATGAIPGSYDVLITKPKATRDGGEIETLPAKYNTKTKLTAEVTAGGDNRFDFELESK